MNGHAQALARSLEIAQRAREDFESGNVDPDPYPGHWGDGFTYARHIQRLTCIRDHGAILKRCCWEHDRHLFKSTRSQYGIRACLDEECRERANRALVELGHEPWV